MKKKTISVKNIDFNDNVEKLLAEFRDFLVSMEIFAKF